MITDTVVQPYNAADTIANIFSVYSMPFSDQQKELQNRVTRRSEALRYNNQILLVKINNLVRAFEQEELDRSLARYQDRDQVMRHSVQVVGGIAVFSLF